MEEQEGETDENSPCKRQRFLQGMYIVSNHDNSKYLDTLTVFILNCLLYMFSNLNKSFLASVIEKLLNEC